MSVWSKLARVAASATLLVVVTTGSTESVEAALDPGAPTVIGGTGEGTRDSQIAYNPDRDEYLVAYVDGSSVVVARLGADGSVLGGPTAIGASGVGASRILPDVAYNSVSERYLVVYATTGSSFQSIIQGVLVSASGGVVGAAQMHGSLGDSLFCQARQPEVAADATSGDFKVQYLHYYGSTTPGANCRGLGPDVSTPVIQTVGADLSLGADLVVPIATAGPDEAHLAVNPVNGDLIVVGVDDVANHGSFRIYSSDFAQRGAGTIPIVENTRGFFAHYFPASDPASGNWLVTSATSIGGNTHTDLVSPTGTLLRGKVIAGPTAGAPHSIAAVGDGTFLIGTVTEKVLHVASDGTRIVIDDTLGNGVLRNPVVATNGQITESAGMVVGQHPTIDAYAAVPYAITAPGASALVPARLLDTRVGAEITTVDGEFRGDGPRPADSVLTLDVAGRGGVPDDASAVLLNIAAAKASANGFVTAFPCDATRPTTSNLNFAAGAAASAAAFSKLSDDGTICLYASAGIEMIVDVNGFVPATASVTSILPARLLETRPGQSAGTTDGLFNGGGRVTAGSVTQLVVAGRGGVASDADAAVLNITAVRPSAQIFVTAYPCDVEAPTAANVNAAAGSFVNNLVFARIGSDGKVCLLSSGETDLIVDVTAFVPAGGAWRSLAPARLFESRAGEMTIDGEQQPGVRVAADSTTTVEIAGRGGAPDDATGATLNVAAIKPSSGGFMTIYPCDAERPNAANLNFGAGSIVSNAVFVKLDPGGKICIYSTAPSDLTVDLVGYSADG